MRPPCFAVFLLVLFIFLSSACVQGIRLEKSIKSAGRPKLHEGTLMETSNNGDMGDQVILCKEGHCTGKGRKLFTASTPTSTTTSKSEENGENKANPTPKVKSGNQENGEKQEKFPVDSPTTSEHQEVQEQYADIMDIAEMDYSPARRKPPIHN
ncbi:hypothetical protein DITRI_Ditri07aG0033600 [Diplodiscus trichospermus]